MYVHIVAGGPETFIPALKEYTMNERQTYWVGVDRGTRYLLANGITPDEAVGDFDSVLQEELHKFKQTIRKVNKYPPEKDATDMEIAIKIALQYKPKLIRIFGATGGRLDHLFANVYLLLNMLEDENGPKVQLIDKQNIVEIKKTGEYTINKDDKKQYISFMAMTPFVENLTLVGFKYPLKDSHISLGSTLCISNELIHDYGTYSFSKGILLVIRSND